MKLIFQNISHGLRILRSLSSKTNLICVIDYIVGNLCLPEIHYQLGKFNSFLAGFDHFVRKFLLLFNAFQAN